jgi:hypothetical protein
MYSGSVAFALSPLDLQSLTVRLLSARGSSGNPFLQQVATTAIKNRAKIKEFFMNVKI